MTATAPTARPATPSRTAVVGAAVVLLLALVLPLAGSALASWLAPTRPAPTGHGTHATRDDTVRAGGLVCGPQQEAYPDLSGCRWLPGGREHAARAGDPWAQSPSADDTRRLSRHDWQAYVSAKSAASGWHLVQPQPAGPQEEEVPRLDGPSVDGHVRCWVLARDTGERFGRCQDGYRFVPRA